MKTAKRTITLILMLMLFCFAVIACNEDKHEHTIKIDPAVPATCTTPGKTEGAHCNECNMIMVASRDIPATGHTEVIDAAVEATCLTAGKSEGKHCSVCNTVNIDNITDKYYWNYFDDDESELSGYLYPGTFTGKNLYSNQDSLSASEYERLLGNAAILANKLYTYLEDVIEDAGVTPSDLGFTNY